MMMMRILFDTFLWWWWFLADETHCCVIVKTSREVDCAFFCSVLWFSEKQCTERTKQRSYKPCHLITLMLLVMMIKMMLRRGRGRGTKTNTVYDQLHVKKINKFLWNKVFHRFQHVPAEVWHKPTYICHSCSTCKITRGPSAIFVLSIRLSAICTFQSDQLI